MTQTLRAIERRVVDEIWIGRTRRLTGATLTAVLAASAITGAVATSGGGYRVVLVAHLVGGVAAVTSVGALVFRRFNWVCAAAYGCTLAALAAGGAIWWYRTGAVAVAWSTVTGCAVAALLGLGWVRLLVTPVERSQPDMRVYTSTPR